VRLPKDQDHHPATAAPGMSEPAPFSGDDLERRFTYHPALSDARQQHHTAVRLACHQAARLLVSACPPGRELALALTNLEQAMYWGNAALARSPDLHAPAPDART
jgi:hypothetical protein